MGQCGVLRPGVQYSPLFKWTLALRHSQGTLSGCGKKKYKNICAKSASLPNIVNKLTKAVFFLKTPGGHLCFRAGPPGPRGQSGEPEKRVTAKNVGPENVVYLLGQNRPNIDQGGMSRFSRTCMFPDKKKQRLPRSTMSWVACTVGLGLLG